MGFAGAARPQGDDILAPINPFAAGKLQHLHLVQGGDGLEVEAVETFDGGELGRLDTPLDHSAFPVDQFQFDQPGQELDMVLPFAGALPGELVILAQERGQLQGLEMVGQKDPGSVGHAALPGIRDM